MLLLHSVFVTVKFNCFLRKCDSNINMVAEWATEPRPSSNILRLIYQGRFLHGNVTLSGKLLILIVHYCSLFTSTKEVMFLPVFVCLFVCP